MISGLRERNIWISTPRQRKLMNCEGRLIGWSMMVMPPFSHFPFFVSNGPCCPLFFFSYLDNFFFLFFYLYFCSGCFSYFLSSRFFCLFAVTFRWHCSLIYHWQFPNSQIPCSIYRLLFFIEPFFFYFFSPPFFFPLNCVLSPLVNVCLCCVLVFSSWLCYEGMLTE